MSNIKGEVKVLPDIFAGNPICLVCGYGQSCPMSALPKIFGSDTTVTPEKFSYVEDQTQTWEQAQSLGRQIALRLKARMRREDRPVMRVQRK